MDRNKLTQLLNDFKAGRIDIADVTDELSLLPFRSVPDAMVDTHRSLRTGYPEVVFGLGKTAQQVLDIAQALFDDGNNVLLTKVSGDKGTALLERFGAANILYDRTAGILLLKNHEIELRGKGKIAVVAAGTSDLPVAREAAFTARVFGNEVEEFYDVGVAGVHRLLHFQAELRAANALIVVAGMEGALPSVVGGLVERPIIAVPTSVGYGASFSGLAALLGMLNSCAPGVTVVNIDNGFGAGYAASQINREEVR